MPTDHRWKKPQEPFPGAIGKEEDSERQEIERWKSKIGLNRAKGLCSPTVCGQRMDRVLVARETGRY